MTRWLNNHGAPISNRLLAALPEEEFQRLAPKLEPVSLAFGKTIYESGDRIYHVYFLNRNTLASLYITMADGASAGASVVGHEGIVGIQAFLRTERTPNRIIVQVAGGAMRMRADELRMEFNRGGLLQDLLLRYTHALFAQVLQVAACNRFHSVEERLSRWLLMIHDRVTSDGIPLTQELLSRRLGAHRSSVSEAAGILRREGLIRYKRGKLTILDFERLKSFACECYGVIKEEFDRTLGNFSPGHSF